MEETEEPLSTEGVHRNRMMLPTRYFLAAPLVMATYLCYEANPALMIIDDTSILTHTINVVAQALMRTLIATYMAIMLRLLMNFSHQKLGLGPEWIPYIRMMDFAAYVFHPFVPSRKLTKVFYGTGDAVSQRPMAALFVILGLVLVAAVLKGISFLLRDLRFLQQIYESFTNVTKPSSGERENVQ